MTARTTGGVSLLGADPATYEPHSLHSSDRAYPETNCYTDIIIEMLHARGDEPLAVLGSLAQMDFEGDQWTFFKPPPEDLRTLFGIDVHEMQPYRPLPIQIEEQLEEGRTIIVELDAWYLPDTESTSYRRAHVKTSVVAEAIDRGAERLRYFHNTSLHELEGDDYHGVFRTGRETSEGELPPYTELVRFDASPRLRGDDLRAGAQRLLAAHLRERPAGNPFERFAGRLKADLPTLLEGGESVYHDYAFATVRMAGAGFSLLGAHVDWVLGDAAAGSSAALGRIADATKLLGFKMARRRPFDPAPQTDELAEAWETGIRSLEDALADG